MKITIREDVRIPLNDKEDIILEKGDQIEVISESMDSFDYVKVNPVTKDFLNKFSLKMKTKKAKLKKTRQSAEVSYTWTLPSGRTITLCGSEESRAWGPLSLIYVLYDDYEIVPIFAMPGKNPKEFAAGYPEDWPLLGSKEFEAYKKNIVKALDYVDSVK